MAKDTAHIDNWFEMWPCLCGNVTKHSRQREFNPNSLQMTSQIESLNEYTGIAETINTRYTLGTRRGIKL